MRSLFLCLVAFWLLLSSFQAQERPWYEVVSGKGTLRPYPEMQDRFAVEKPGIKQAIQDYRLSQAIQLNSSMRRRGVSQEQRQTVLRSYPYDPLLIRVEGGSGLGGFINRVTGSG